MLLFSDNLSALLLLIRSSKAGIQCACYWTVLYTTAKKKKNPAIFTWWHYWLAKYSLGCRNNIHVLLLHIRWPAAMSSARVPRSISRSTSISVSQETGSFPRPAIHSCKTFIVICSGLSLHLWMMDWILAPFSSSRRSIPKFMKLVPICWGMLMRLSLPRNLISSISVGWSPVRGIISQVPLNWCMHWSHSQTITTRTGNEEAFFQYSVATQLLHASACVYYATA